MRQALLVLVVVAAVAAPTALAVTPAQYRAKVRAACTQANKSSQAIPNPTTKKQTVAALQQTIAIGNKLVSELRGVDPPSNLEKLHAQAISAVRDEIAFLEVLVQRVQGGSSLDKLSQELGSQEKKLETGATKVFAALGVSSCAD